MSYEGNLYYWRQFLVVSAVLLQCFSVGVALAYSSVLCPALLSSNTTDIRTTQDQASWLSASLGFTGIIGCLMLPCIMGAYGRRILHLSTNIFQLIGWIIFYFADSVTVLFVGRIFQGVGISVLYINGVLISEYSDPLLRGYYMTVKTMFIGVGVMFCHTSVLFLSWRQVAIITAVLPVLAVLLTLIWPESPAYLALRGRFSECEKSFKWLHGSSNKSNKELNELISAQREELNQRRTRKTSWRSILKIFLKKDFQKSLLISTLLTICIDTCGRYFLYSYVIQIITELVDDSSMVAYYVIAGDLLTIFALLLAGPVIKYFKRRTVLLGLGSISVLLIFAISLTTYLKSNFTVLNTQWLSPCLILAQMFIINLSVVPVCITIMGEIFTLEDRSLGSCLGGVIFSLLYALNIKFTSIFITTINVEGAYAVNAMILSICLIILYFIVPETKDRTLQDIEDEIKGVKRDITETQMMLLKETGQINSSS